MGAEEKKVVPVDPTENDQDSKDDARNVILEILSGHRTKDIRSNIPKQGANDELHMISEHDNRTRRYAIFIIDATPTTK